MFDKFFLGQINCLSQFLTSDHKWLNFWGTFMMEKHYLTKVWSLKALGPLQHPSEFSPLNPHHLVHCLAALLPPWKVNGLSAAEHPTARLTCRPKYCDFKGGPSRRLSGTVVLLLRAPAVTCEPANRLNRALFAESLGYRAFELPPAATPERIL